MTAARRAGSLRSAFDKTVRAAADVDDIDAGLVALGRKYADRIDQALLEGEGQEVTKALYLGPHFLGVLREMLATPASRKAAGEGTKAATGTLAKLRAVNS